MSKFREQQLTATDLALALGEQHEDTLLQLGNSEDSKSLLRRTTSDWPQIGAASRLATLATNRPMYLAFLAYLANGVRITTAAKALGILSREITDWLNQGVNHVNQQKESVYAWFYLDCYQARGTSLLKAELQAYQNNPTEFITRMDAGGQFNREEAIGPEALFRADEQSMEDMNANDNALTGADVEEAFKALAAKGVNNLESFAQEAKSQALKSNESNSPNTQ